MKPIPTSHLSLAHLTCEWNQEYECLYFVWILCFQFTHRCSLFVCDKGEHKQKKNNTKYPKKESPISEKVVFVWVIVFIKHFVAILRLNRETENQNTACVWIKWPKRKKKSNLPKMMFSFYIFSSRVTFWCHYFCCSVYFFFFLVWCVLLFSLG